MKTFFLHILFFAISASSVCAQAISHSLCANDPRVKRYFVTNPVPGMAYSWTVSGGGIVQPSNNDTLYVNWGNIPGIYTVSLHGIFNASCETDTAIYNVEILPIPTLNITGNTNVCVGEKITLNASGANQITWSNNTTGNTAEYIPQGNEIIWARGYDGTCFSDTSFFNLNPVPLPNAAFTANPTEGEAPLKVSFYNVSQNATIYLWDFGNGITSTEINPTTIYQNPGNYLVTLYSENTAGCRDSLTFQYIVVNEAFAWFIPNSFTPNDDNLNEIFRPYFPDFVEYSLGIFDRWGNVIYQSTSVNGAWDGTLDGKDVPIDVYTYRIEFRTTSDNKLVEQIGSVTLVR